MRPLTIAVCLTLLLLSDPAFCDTFASDCPSDHIKVASLPSTMALSGTTGDSLASISKMLPELAKEPRWEMPDLGYLTSEKQEIMQEANVGVPVSATGFLGNETALPASVGNATGNITEINSTSEGLIYL